MDFRLSPKEEGTQKPSRKKKKKYSTIGKKKKRNNFREGARGPGGEKVIRSRGSHYPNFQRGPLRKHLEKAGGFRRNQ